MRMSGKLNKGIIDFLEKEGLAIFISKELTTHDFLHRIEYLIETVGVRCKDLDYKRVFATDGVFFLSEYFLKVGSADTYILNFQNNTHKETYVDKS